ncbi:hypothetical protein K9L67_00025 [Candidatus Woesearchaeota archaeon]|nr:hypothetical protein [Candidatus Woesearchaeota archaeon]MCF7900593.1 hypothetical protein [Candidatus Woesearchaeota archaeon]MCF8013409.1 hypothetical protein [Candidatus Woesearchaeota archaeon]
MIKKTKNIFEKVFEDKFNRIFIPIIILLGIFLIFAAPTNTSTGTETGQLDVHFFFLPSCPHCQEQKPFNQQLMKEYPQVNWIYHDTSNSKENEIYFQMAVERGLDIKTLGVPGTFIGDKEIIGFGSKETTGVEIRQALEEYIAQNAQEKNQINETTENNETNQTEEFQKIIKLPIFGEINVLEVSLPVLSILLGFVDGMNPCAMWVLVYLISLILEVRDRKKIWLLVGTFLLSSGVLYFLLMTAWLNAFLLVGYIRAVTIIIGLVALYFGVTSIKSFIETKGAIQCEVGNAESKKKTMSKMKQLVASPLTWATLVGMVGLAFIINSIEFVCSAALPAIFTQVLAISDISGVSYYLYILLYVFFFMLDDLIIFSFAVFAVNKFLGDKYAKWCKLIGGIIMLILGIIMVFFPNILR